MDGDLIPFLKEKRYCDRKLPCRNIQFRHNLGICQCFHQGTSPIRAMPLSYPLSELLPNRWTAAAVHIPLVTPPGLSGGGPGVSPKPNGCRENGDASNSRSFR